jgi:hypothetical protein
MMPQNKLLILIKFNSEAPRLAVIATAATGSGQPTSPSLGPYRQDEQDLQD